MMISPKRVLLASLALQVLLCSLLSTEARRYAADEDNETTEPRHHHRHRHRHEVASQRWSGSSTGRSSGNSKSNDDYYEDNYPSDNDYQDEYGENGETDSEEDYATERRNSRLYPPKRTSGNTHHRYEPRYQSSRYHHRGSHHSTVGTNGHNGYLEVRGHDRPGHHGRTGSNPSRTSYRKRHRDADDDDSLEDDRASGTRRRSYQDQEDSDEYPDNEYYYPNKYRGGSSRKRITGRNHAVDVGESKKHRRSRYEPRKDWRYKSEEEDDELQDEYAYDADDEYEAEAEDEDAEDYERANRSRKYYSRKSRFEAKSEINGRRSSSGSKLEEWLKRTKQSSSNGSRSHDSSRRRNSRPSLQASSEDRDDEDEDVELWRAWNEDPGDDNGELDNDFYKNDEASTKQPLRTFDDIIRRLTHEEDKTSGTTSTPKPTTPVKRNTDLESHLRRDAFGNLRLYESKRNTSTTQRTSQLTRNLNLVDGTKKQPWGEKKRKSLEEYDEDNGRKTGDEESGAQADTNTDYLDDENEAEEVSSVATSSSTTAAIPTTPTTTSTTTTSTTTTTQRPNIPASGGSNVRKDPRGYDSPSTGSQYNGYQAKSDYPAMSDYSARKWQYLGTRDSVKETRNNMSQFNKNGKYAMNAAHIHALRVAKEGSCQWPRARVIPVRDVYPNSTATYIPHCAILHRCSDDTGCCRSETLTCEAKHTERVELYFYATYIHGKTEIEKLSFTNHTECECRERKDFGSANDRMPEYRSARHFPYSPAPQNIVRPTRKPCRCPTQFTSKITIDGVCECSCIEHDQDCLKLQRGKGILSFTDRMCIQRQQCTAPSCTFGEFITGQGRCPKKKDIFDANASHRANFNYYQRRS